MTIVLILSIPSIMFKTATVNISSRENDRSLKQYLIFSARFNEGKHSRKVEELKQMLVQRDSTHSCIMDYQVD